MEWQVAFQLYVLDIKEKVAAVVVIKVLVLSINLSLPLLPACTDTRTVAWLAEISVDDDLISDLTADSSPLWQTSLHCILPLYLRFHKEEILSIF